MSNCFHCKLCEKSNKNKSKKKHLNCQYHQSLTKRIISRYYVGNPDFLHIEDLLENYVNIYIKKFELYLVICK